MNIISRIFCYPLLERQLDECDKEIIRLRAELIDWQNKVLNKHGFSSLGEETRESVRGGDVAASQQFNLKPFIAQAHERWDEEEYEELQRFVPPLSEVEQIDILSEAESISQ